jgi:SRSO17 transposase
VVRQYCGQVGKQENCRIAVSLSVATEQVSLPIAWRLYLPEIWAKDHKRRKATGVPPEVTFATKPAIALQQIQRAVEEEVTKAPVLADAAYGNDSQFREGLRELGLEYVVGVQKSTTVFEIWNRSVACETVEGDGTPADIVAQGQTASTGGLETAGRVFATAGLEKCLLA